MDFCLRYEGLFLVHCHFGTLEQILFTDLSESSFLKGFCPSSIGGGHKVYRAGSFLLLLVTRMIGSSSGWVKSYNRLMERDSVSNPRKQYLPEVACKVGLALLCVFFIAIILTQINLGFTCAVQASLNV